MRRSKKILAKCFLFGIVFVILANVLIAWVPTKGIYPAVDSANQASYNRPLTVRIQITGYVARESNDEPTKEAKTRGFFASESDDQPTKEAKTRGVFASESLRDDQPSKEAKTRAFLVIGVPTVQRPKSASYLSQTLRDLVEGLEEHEKREVLIIVLITDFNPSAINSIQKEISDSFANEVNSGLLRVVKASRSFYPSLDNLPRLWGDSPERARWRSKQCLDYAFLFEYSKDLGDYYLQIEDDISATKGYLKNIKKFITTNQKRKWSVLEFGARGFIGMMYRTSDVGRLSIFVKTYFWAFPVDILYRQFNIFHLYGNPDWARYRPPIFRHVGIFSSLVGQVRALEDINLTHRVYKDSDNPPAELNTSIVGYKKYRIPAAYDSINHGMFWGKDVKMGDYILIRFYSLVRVSKVIVESGGVLAPEDYFGGARLSYGSSDEIGQCGNFTVWQECKDTGQLKAQSKNPKGILCQCLKIEITEVRKDKRGNTRWLAIREIAVWTAFN